MYCTRWLDDKVIEKVFDWYREEDLGEHRRSELNDLVDKMTCLNAFEWKFWKNEKSNQDIVMNGKFVKNSVMNAKF